MLKAQVGDGERGRGFNCELGVSGTVRGYPDGQVVGRGIVEWKVLEGRHGTRAQRAMNS